MITDKNTKHNDFLPPEEMVGRYYHALYKGDLESLKAMMTEESYIMTLEPFSIKLSFHDSVFKTLWDQREESKDALHEVEKKISKELLSRNLSPQIEIKKTEENGLERMIVHYIKEGKNKKLYFSKEGSDWRINYFAGRYVPAGYFASLKNWMISILPKFK
jgi:hypothetical protein